MFLRPLPQHDDLHRARRTQHPQIALSSGPRGLGCKIPTPDEQTVISSHRRHCKKTSQPIPAHPCRATSYKTMLAATPAFKDSTCGACGMATT